MISSSMVNRLYIKLSITLISVFILLGTATFYFSQDAMQRYSNEMLQTLNKDIARHINTELSMIEKGKVNTDALKHLAHQAMVIHPAIEVFLLDPNGKIISHALDKTDITQSKIDLTPIKQATSDNPHFPIYGEDPRDPNAQKIFSASKIENNGVLEGYIYIILNGKKYQTLVTSLIESPIIKSNGIAIGICILIGLFICLFIFYTISKRLTKLTHKINEYYQSNYDELPFCVETQDEIQQLCLAFDALQSRIDQQMEQIKNADHTRRELVTHISHDLRTPLTNIQGYIDTLILKNNDFSKEEVSQYLHVCRTHIKRLSNLVSDLFELSKLDSNAIKPEFETFSLTELIHDITQGYQLKARENDISLEFNPYDNAMVCADIGLIERAISNLIDNALNHTQKHGKIEINLNIEENGARVSISDTGNGIEKKDLPYIFDRLFHIQNPHQTDMKSTGLGLAIVKRILDLHQAKINVISQVKKGSTFSFKLARI